MKAILLFSALVFLPSSAEASFPSSRVHRTQVPTHHSNSVIASTERDRASSKPLESILVESSDMQPGRSMMNPVIGRLAFLHRYGAVASHTSRAKKQPIISPSESEVQSKTTYNSVQSVLTIRGGASTNSVQNAIRSILESSLPSPIKQFIQMICQLLENLTGFKILPEKSKKSKSGKLKSKEVLVEKVSSRRTSTKSRQSKSHKADEKDTTKEKHTKSKSVTTEKDDSDSETAESNEKVTDEETNPTTTPVAPKPQPKTDAASKKFLSNNLKSSNPNYRIQRELKEFISSPPPGLSVKISGKNVRLWIITLTMPENTIYAGEVYKLRVQFPANYPTSPPSVYFLPPTPRHEHVYTNGDICLSLLGKDWRPIMTAQSLAQAIMSILCGAQRKSLPMDNSRHAGNKPGQRQDDWVYHDDNC
jgi:ubiquitin-conjugating enzyme E2 W